MQLLSSYFLPVLAVFDSCILAWKPPTEPVLLCPEEALFFIFVGNTLGGLSDCKLNSPLILVGILIGSLLEAAADLI